MQMLKFLKDHALVTWALVLGPFISVGVKLNDAYTLYNLGLPRLAWEAVGTSMFFGAVIVLLFRFYQEQDVARQSGTKAAPPPTASRTRAYTPAELTEIAQRAPVTGLDLVKRIERLEQGNNLAAPVVEPSAAPAPVPKRYFSSAEREKYGSALFELRDICKRDGDKIFKNVGTFLVDWQSRAAEVGNGQEFQGPYILKFIDLIRGQTDNFELGIYSPDGVIGQNPAFPELKDCVGTGAGTIGDLKIALSHFECAVKVAEKLEDKKALGMMTWAVMAPLRDNLATAQNKFGGWLRETENQVRAREEDLKQ